MQIIGVHDIYDDVLSCFPFFKACNCFVKVLEKRQRFCLLCILFFLKFHCLAEMIASLKKQESEPNYSQNLIKASKKLSKTSTEADIRVIVEGLLQKNNEDMYVT